MEWIERYIYQVGRRLPQRMRADVEQELRSLLTDALEQRAGHRAEGGDFSPEEQIAVLEEFGPPEEMADRYQPQPRYIIGPRLYDLYLLVITVVAGAGLLAAVIATTVSMLADGPRPAVWELLLRTWTIWMNIALSGIGSTTLVFALLDRLIPAQEFTPGQDKPWNPRDLPAVERHDEIQRGGLITEVVFLTLLMAIILSLGNRAGLVYYDGTWHQTPAFLSAAFFSLYLPLFLVRWGLTILLNLVLLRQGRWQPGLRIADLLLHGLDVYILARLLGGPTAINIEAFQVALAAAPEGAETLARLAERGLQMGFWIALIASVAAILYKLYHIVRQRQASKLEPAPR